MNAQGTFFDHRVRPGPTDQLVLKDGLTGALNQCDQDIERPTAEPQRLSVFKDQPLRRTQPKRSQR